MNVALETCTLSIHRWSSTEAARTAWPGVIMLNEETPPGEVVYELRKFGEAPSTGNGRVVGFQMADSLQPLTVLGTMFGSLIWLGGNDQALGLSADLEVQVRVDLRSQFSYFHLHAATSQLVIVAEVAICAVSSSGVLAWRHDLDLITALEWSDAHVLVEQEGRPAVRIDVATGSSQLILA